MVFIVAALLCASLAISNADVLPVSVKGNQILIGGKPGSLAGMSLSWSNTGWEGAKFYNKEVMEWLKKDWKVKVVRAAMGIEAGGYLEEPEVNKARVKAVVDAAIDLDMYVIIDWHDHNAHQHQTEAIEFFEEMAKTYGGKNNVMYELWNEPQQISWKDQVKPYAEAVIKAIRAIDKTNMILVGSPTWSQDVEVAASDPIAGYENIAYTLHFYAGTHGQFLRDKATVALNKGVAVFVTEWGSVNVEGTSSINVKETNAWVDFMRVHNLSHCNYCLNDKQETESSLKPGSSTSGGWSESDLTESGKHAREIIRNWYNSNESY